MIKSRGFGRRAMVMGTAKMLLLSGLIGRMYYLQILKSDKFKTLADGNRIRLLPTIPPRGKITDRYGNVIASGIPRYQVLFDPPDFIGKNVNVEEVLRKVADILELSDEKYADVLSKAKKKYRRGTIIIDDYIDWDKVAKIEVNYHDLPGITVTSPEVRNYPHGKNTAHLTGYIGAASKDEIEESLLYRPLYMSPDFRIGKSGIEKTMEEKLRGRAGLRHIEVNARGAYVRELEADDGLPGEDVKLTIDIELQNFIAQQLAGKGGIDTEAGSAVVLDIETGDVVAMASVPSYDPNRFIKGIDHDYWQSLISNRDGPFNNKAISSKYPPGSTFKPAVVLAALEEGVIDENTEVKCPGYFELGDRRFHCWKKSGHGKVNLRGALAGSCNVFFYSVSLKLGVDKIAKTIRKLGLGEKTGIELPGEREGIVPTKDWKLATLGKQWLKGETLNTSIGQGYNLTTPLQLAVMTARIASGKKVEPHIMLDSSSEKEELVVLDTGEKILLPKHQRIFEDLDFHPTNLQRVRDGMDAVVNDETGSVYNHRIKEKEFAFAGKTGTAQVVSRQFREQPQKRKQRYHSVFIGYAPTYAPKYAVSVVVEHGGYGSAAAAPIGRQILEKVQKLSKE